MARTELLTSAKNPLLKEVRRAIVRGSLTESGLCVAESFHLLEEALRSDCKVETVLAAASVRNAVAGHVRGLKSLQVIAIADELFQRIASTETSQGVIALVRPPAWSLEHLLRGNCLAVVLDGVQDPGNAGAIVRAAEAFGATGAAFLKGTVSPYNPKCLRAAAGSLFRLPVVQGIDEQILLAALEQRRVDLYAALPRGGKLIGEADLTRACAIAVGGEGRGVSRMLQARALDLRIPTSGVESLNVAMAASVILYEARRQRTGGKPQGNAS
jgi:TrmH family RNA methyltransferase